MKDTEVLTLGAVGVIILYTRAKVCVHTTKLLHVIMAGYISRLAIVATCSPCASF